MNDRDTKFDDIRPYYEEEIPAAMERIAQHGSFPLLASYVYPHEDIEKTREQIRSYKTIRDFQLEVMRCVNEQVIARSMTWMPASCNTCFTRIVTRPRKSRLEPTSCKDNC